MFLALICFSSLVSAGNILPDREQIDSWLTTLGSDNQFDPNKGIDWGVMPGPFYTPELQVGLGVAVVGMYRPDITDTVSQNSTVSVSGFVSSTGAFGLNLENYSFFANDQWRFYLTSVLNDMPTYYWGIGFNAGNKRKYTSKEFSIKPSLLYRIMPDTYLGLGWSFSSLHASSLDRQSVISSGVSTTFIYDTRDFVPNPSRGQAINLIYTYYSPELASDERFSILRSRYSIYHSFNEKDVLAWEIDGNFSQANVPWNMLPLLGNNNQMRGYYEGRYRDNNTLTTQLELRHKLNWRHGIIGWLGTGTMSPRVRELGKSRWLPSVGVGYRFEFKPRMNVRLDFGIGKGSTGFYFQVGEAF